MCPSFSLSLVRFFGQLVGGDFPFNGRLVTERRIEYENFDLTLKLYLMEVMKIMFESNYIDSSQSVLKALELETIGRRGHAYHADP